MALALWLGQEIVRYTRHTEVCIFRNSSSSCFLRCLWQNFPLNPVQSVKAPRLPPNPPNAHMLKPCLRPRIHVVPGWHLQSVASSEAERDTSFAPSLHTDGLGGCSMGALNTYQYYSGLPYCNYRTKYPTTYYSGLPHIVTIVQYTPQPSSNRQGPW